MIRLPTLLRRPFYYTTSPYACQALFESFFQKFLTRSSAVFHPCGQLVYYTTFPLICQAFFSFFSSFFCFLTFYTEYLRQVVRLLMHKVYKLPKTFGRLANSRLEFLFNHSKKTEATESAASAKEGSLFNNVEIRSRGSRSRPRGLPLQTLRYRR